MEKSLIEEATSTALINFVKAIWYIAHTLLIFLFIIHNYEIHVSHPSIALHQKLCVYACVCACPSKFIANTINSNKKPSIAGLCTKWIFHYSTQTP